MYYNILSVEKSNICMINLGQIYHTKTAIAANVERVDFALVGTLLVNFVHPYVLFLLPQSSKAI